MTCKKAQREKLQERTIYLKALSTESFIDLTIKKKISSTPNNSSLWSGDISLLACGKQGKIIHRSLLLLGFNFVVSVFCVAKSSLVFER